MNDSPYRQPLAPKHKIIIEDWGTDGWKEKLCARLDDAAAEGYNVVSHSESSFSNQIMVIMVKP